MKVKLLCLLLVSDKLCGIIAVSDTLKETSKTGIENYIRWG
jgi:cation transport ATPase